MKAAGKKKATKATPKKRRAWQEKFLTSLRQSPNVSAAAKAAGHNRQHAYAARETDAEFARQWDDAIEEAIDNLDGEMYRRAVYGTEKPVFGPLGPKLGSGEIGRIQEYSDTLAIFLAKAHRPAKYREKVDQLNLNIDVSQLNDQQLEMVAHGADIRAVLAITSKGGAGTETPAADERPGAAA